MRTLTPFDVDYAAMALLDCLSPFLPYEALDYGSEASQRAGTTSWHVTLDTVRKATVALAQQLGATTLGGPHVCPSPRAVKRCRRG